MRITRIDIESRNGNATLTLDFHTGQPKVRVTGHAGDGVNLARDRFDDWGPISSADQLAALARRLQIRLDGHAGTAADVAVYHRLLEQML